MHSVYPTGVTIYDPDRCWNGFTLLDGETDILQGPVFLLGAVPLAPDHTQEEFLKGARTLKMQGKLF